jgi:prolyl 4-hydroxylase
MAQTITPALKAWIIAQWQAGCTAESVLQAMKTAGWEEGLAIRAIQQVLAEQFQAQAQAQASVPTMPHIDTAGAQQHIDLGDRLARVRLVMQRPRVVVLDQLLSDAECDALIEAAKPRMARSLTVETVSGGVAVNAARTSQGMFFERGQSDVIRTLEARIARLVQWPVERGEGLQVLHYLSGAEYKPHHDYFDPEQPGTATILRRGGQRLASLVMYLNQPEAGGGTTFPDVGLEVAPRKGSAVFFSYPRAHPDTLTLHAGAPVVAGEKWVATKWFREGVFQ